LIFQIFQFFQNIGYISRAYLTQCPEKTGKSGISRKNYGFAIMRTGKTGISMKCNAFWPSAAEIHCISLIFQFFPVLMIAKPLFFLDIPDFPVFFRTLVTYHVNI